MTVTVQLVRHGKTKGNLEKRFAGGKTDDSLCSQGKEELLSFVSDSIYLSTKEVFSSPMKRCLETAGILFPECSADMNIIEEFKELDFGIFENRNHEELNGNDDYQKWLDSKGKGDIPGGERMNDFAKRVMVGFEKMISSAKANEMTAVVHGGTIMAILFSLNGGNFYDYLCKNGRGYVFEYSTEDKRILDLRKI